MSREAHQRFRASRLVGQLEDRLFLAGIIPGLLIVTALALYSSHQGRNLPPSTIRLSRQRVPALLRESVWELLLPLAQAYGVDPVHLGIIFLTNLEIGYSTPPVALNLFIASIRFERPVLELHRASLPFPAILLLVLLVVTYVPELSLFLTRR